ncbi:MAG: hypothetical protein COV75_00745 [Candidatus Omnitrophica bacterium CG11_big_fil_rev_8_21_14_0_20_63_9]|nr:MAG: hypothetical protein COV75_00745 [Candidatus Omnitrophica bacterium CG11_big_fil_rev_8_21_14_0_20_63_9]
MLGRLYETVPSFLRPVEFRIVRTVAELKTANHLVYQEYLKRNYCKANAVGLKLSLYQALPTTATFIATHRRDGIIGTISMVEDSPLGLPMDEAYKNEVDMLRRQNLRVAEVTMLALNSQLFGERVFTLFHAKKLLLTLRLFKVMFDYLRACTKVDELVACFNPKHQVLYDFLQLKPLGGLKTYTSANSNPSIARHLNIRETERQAKAHAAYRLFYGAKPSPKPFEGKCALTPEDLRALFVVTAPVLTAASPTELNYLASCYPTYRFNQILQPHDPSPSPHLS